MRHTEFLRVQHITLTISDPPPPKFLRLNYNMKLLPFFGGERRQIDFN